VWSIKSFYCRVMKSISRGEVQHRVAIPRTECSPHGKRSLIGIIDNDQHAQISMIELLRSAGFNAAAFSSGEAFLKSDGTRPPDCLIVDPRMPGLAGLDLQLELARMNRSIPVIFATASYDNEARSRALQQGAIAFLYKPFSDDVLLALVQLALR
jgi:FixJ family two-component response regulator